MEKSILNFRFVMSLLWLLFLFGGLCHAQEYESVAAAKLEPQEMADLINTIYTDQEKVFLQLLNYILVGRVNYSLSFGTYYLIVSS